MDERMGQYAAVVESLAIELERREVIHRIWQRDHTVWKSDPAEISNRLGWLTVSGVMRPQVEGIVSFANEIKNAGFRHVVLLGMGGSSLGPEVIRQTLGSAEGFPELIVLDSTLPERVAEVVDIIDPARTLFMISSKSGTTIEPLCLLSYFGNLLVSAVGAENAGQHIIAVTDPGTHLAEMGRVKGFRHVFINPPDIGGRYSVLSLFGLVPAALIGVDVVALLDAADAMRRFCIESKSFSENPGAGLGAAIAALALKGRDKLTLITSPSVQSFGLWADQLLAESTGKEGKGVVPIVGEPLVDAAHYGNDRVFVYLRMATDDNTASDAAIEAIAAAGHPVISLHMADTAALGAEFFRWEFATAVIGAGLNIHPFDQPNVQQAKSATDGVLKEYASSGQLWPAQSAKEPSLSDLLGQAKPGDYLALLAYLPQSESADRLLMELRRQVVERYQIATTVGYGPRYLHSTGQLHKGGSNAGLFYEVTIDHARDVPIPNKAYTFGILADAQALGDFRALEASGRRVSKVHLKADDPSALSRAVLLV